MSTKMPATYYRMITGPIPAVGQDFTLAAPGGEYWRMVALAFTLTTSAAVANRIPRLRAGDGTDNCIWVSAPAAQTATQVVTYSGLEGSVTEPVVGSVVSLRWPTRGLLLPPGYRVQSDTIAIDVADQYSDIAALVQVFPQGPTTEWLPTVDTQLTEMG